jgi:hypothetical protein
MKSNRLFGVLVLSVFTFASSAQAQAQFARDMPGFPVKTSVVDEQLSRNPSALGRAEFLIKNISKAKQTGQIEFDNWVMSVHISIANCKGDNDGESVLECCGTAAAPVAWLGAGSYKACKQRFNMRQSCDLPPIINGDCKDQAGNLVIDTPGASRGKSIWNYDGKWVQSDDPQYHVFAAGIQWDGTKGVKVPDQFQWDKGTDGKLDLTFKRNRGVQSLTAPFEVGPLGEESNAIIGRSVNCGFTKTGLSCTNARPALYKSAIPGCRRNAEGEITDVDPCIAKATVNLSFDVNVGVYEDRGAIMGSYFGFTSLWGSGEADRDRVNIPLNSGLPF